MMIDFIFLKQVQLAYTPLGDEKNGVVSRCLPHRHLRATQYTVATARIEPATLRLHDKNPTAIPLWLINLLTY